MIKQVSTYISTNKLLSPDGLHLVALSGGGDSVALLRILLTLGYKVEAMHCNFHLRGEESNRDEEFCKTLCQEHNVPLHIAHFDTKTYASMHHISIEMAARDLRYNYFRQLLRDIEAESICVAHHKDDCAETLLMNIIRGTGITGLTGIRPKNGVIIRPLLCVTRSDIEDYLSTIHQSFVTDSTNLTDDVVRNKIRLDILPLIKSINPSAVESLSSTAEHVTDALPFLTESLQEHIIRCMARDGEDEIIDIDALKNSPSPSYLLFSILYERGFSSAIASQIARHLDSQSGRSWTCGDKTAVIDRGRIVIAKQKEQFAEMKLPIVGNYVLRNGAKLQIEEQPYTEGMAIDRSPMSATMDASTLSFPLTLREVRNGDRFVPFGMKGSKLVSDFLTDRKLSVIEKQRQLCLCDSKGVIIWIVGQRINNRNRIDSNTIKILRVRYLL